MKSSERLALLPADTTAPLDPHSPHSDTETGFFARGIEEETNPSAEIFHSSEIVMPVRRVPRLLAAAGIFVLLTVIWIFAR
jgi:hypothetical protein